MKTFHGWRHLLCAAGLLAGTTTWAAPRPPAPEPPAGEVRAVVEGLLSGYEPGDPAPALRRIGPAATDALLALSTDKATSPLRRLRAIEALGYVPTPAGLQFLRQLIAPRRTATDSLAVFEVAAAARALGGHGAAGLGELTSLADHPAADVREAVATALGQIRTPEAMRALRQRMALERDSGVVLVLRGALRPQR